MLLEEEKEEIFWLVSTLREIKRNQRVCGRSFRRRDATGTNTLAEVVVSCKRVIEKTFAEGRASPFI